ncbi:MAG: hypothetical protein ACHQ7N_12825 [Candidatus Methylomirabilales bacterium]
MPSQEALAGGRPVTVRLVQVRKESDLSGRKLVGLAGVPMPHHQDGCLAKVWKEIGKLIGTSPAWKERKRLRPAHLNRRPDGVVREAGGQEVAQTVCARGDMDPTKPRDRLTPSPDAWAGMDEAA